MLDRDYGTIDRHVIKPSPRNNGSPTRSSLDIKSQDSIFKKANLTNVLRLFYSKTNGVGTRSPTNSRLSYHLSATTMPARIHT